jgi:hypothetical protein
MMAKAKIPFPLMAQFNAQSHTQQKKVRLTHTDEALLELRDSMNSRSAGI